VIDAGGPDEEEDEEDQKCSNEQSPHT
jgi:hypothetical protein